MEKGEYAIDLSALDVKADRLERRMRNIERRLYDIGNRYEAILVAKNHDEVMRAMRGVLCEDCQERRDEEREYRPEW